MINENPLSLAVALGNPGPEYELTKHNIGMLVLDEFLAKKHISKDSAKNKFHSLYIHSSISGLKTHFLYPQTYMNLSGQAVRPCMDFFKIPLNEMICLHDELDLPLGEVQIKQGGGMAGHNGLKSLEQHLGSNNYLRLRIGIGRPQYGSVSDWVLSSWPKEEWSLVEKVMAYGADVLESIFTQGTKRAANLYNKKNILKI